MWWMAFVGWVGIVGVVFGLNMWVGWVSRWQMPVRRESLTWRVFGDSFKEEVFSRFIPVFWFVYALYPSLFRQPWLYELPAGT